MHSPHDAPTAAKAFAIWSLALLAACGALAVGALGVDSIWRTFAHESEPRSLLATLLFPGHALRELPHLLVLALAFLAGAAPPRDRRDLATKLRGLLAVAGAAGALLLLAASLEAGVHAALADLLQSYGAPDLVARGVHVRLHLASDLALGALFFVAGCAVAPAPSAAGERAALPLALAGAMLLAMALTAGFEGVASPRFVGHAARELQAHAMLTLPAMLAAALTAPGARFDPAGAARRGLARGAAAVALASGGWLVWRAARIELGLASSAPERPWWLNLAVHQFEHLIDLGFLLLAAAAWRRAGQRRSIVA